MVYENQQYADDTPRYKKKSTAKPPKKAKHKHLAEPCVMEYPFHWYKKPHEQNGRMCNAIGAYCPICGKIGELLHYNRWYVKGGSLSTVDLFAEFTEEAMRELDPDTRTLPTFSINDPFAKYVTLPTEEKED